MSNALNIIKIIGSWGCLIGACICLILLKQAEGLPMILSVLSIAFSQAPTSG